MNQPVPGKITAPPFPIFPQHMAISLTTAEFCLGLFMSRPLGAGQTHFPSAAEKRLFPKPLSIDIHCPTLQTHFSQQTQTSLSIAVLHLDPDFISATQKVSWCEGKNSARGYLFHNFFLKHLKALNGWRICKGMRLTHNPEFLLLS